MKTQTEIYYQSVHQYHTPLRHYRITLKVGVLDITAQVFHYLLSSSVRLAL